jgi:Domain of unknown function (DUF4136)
MEDFMINRNDTIKGWRYIFWIGMVIAVSACSSVSVQSSAKYDPNIDYAGYKTFNWMPKDDTADTAEAGAALQSRPITSEAARMIESELEKGLEAKGFKKLASGTPDFYVNYHARVQDKVEPRVQTYTCAGRICGQAIDMNKVREGTMILDIIQPDSNEVVWRGTAVAQAVDAVDPSHRKEIIETAVRQLLNVFPPK